MSRRAIPIAALAGGATFVALFVRYRLLRRPKIDYPAPESLVIEPDGDDPAVRAKRFLPLGSNFRDIGGYQTADGHCVRWGTVYRSGALGDLSEADLELLSERGLKTVCDLRTTRELHRNPDHLPQTIKYLHQPILGDEESADGFRVFLLNLHRLSEVMLKSYTHRMVDRKARRFGNILRYLADPEHLPAVIHCTAGKDRTGITIALLLALLGVPESVIVADYSLTNLFFNNVRDAVAEDVKRLAPLRITINDLQPLLTADPQLMRGTLEHIRHKYGSVEAYLRDAAGLEDGAIARLRELLLE